MVYWYMFGATDNHIIYDRCDCRIKKEATNDITRRTIERKEIYPRTEIPQQGTDVGLRTARERAVGDILYHHGRSVLGSVL